MKKHLAMLALIALSGCTTSNTTGSTNYYNTAVSPASNTPKIATQGLKGTCGNALSQYQSVLDNDLSTGHVNKSVYGNIISDLQSSVSSCAAGNESTSLSQLASIKGKYGYPVR